MKRWGLTLVALGAACSSGGSSFYGEQPDSGTGDAGASRPVDDGGTTDANAVKESGTTSGPTVRLTGEVEGYTSRGPVEGVEVAAAGATSATDSAGIYELMVPSGAPLRLELSRSGYFTTLDVEMKLSKTFDRTKLRLVDSNVAQTLMSVLQGDPSKALVTVELVALPSCADADFPQGATITTNQASAKVVYYKSTPNPDLTSAQAGQNPAAIIVNATPGQALTVTVSHPSCETKPFPTVVDGVTYTGKLVPRANETLNLHRVYLE